MTRSRLTLLILLASCGGSSSTSTPAPTPPPVPNDGTFALELDPPTLDVHRLETGSIHVSVSRRTGISGPVTLSFVTYAAGLETTSATIRARRARSPSASPRPPPSACASRSSRRSWAEAPTARL